MVSCDKLADSLFYSCVFLNLVFIAARSAYDGDWDNVAMTGGVSSIIYNNYRLGHA